ncbi:MAG: metallophosphoesterase [Deltaproteobacteria bacterium]|nr:metallophosphoesterase [Deltaproteobacteria bacterium]MBW2153777.1 metallophosphoesterase [Deltaproteobacteria bacterium]
MDVAVSDKKENGKDTMLDSSFLPEAEIEFFLLSDTHYMIDPGTDALEFESRRLQSPRIQNALSLMAGFNVAFIVHLGDLVQEYPEREGFRRAVIEAHEQFARFGIKCRQVAGNHDMGDKPDPTMPTDWVNAVSLRAYHEKHGCSWYSWDVGDLHCIVLNSQIMNSALPEAKQQRQWLESDLQNHGGKRTFIFIHLPIYLENTGEPSLGHYDNIDEPDRSWLLKLIRTYRVEAVFAGHSHFSFFDRIGDTRYYIAPSTSFTRPGFAECFTSCPPDEQGRNDIGKLGFYLVRVVKKDIRVHFIRTWGETELVEDSMRESRVITRLSHDLPYSPTGISLRYPLSKLAEIPIAFPSMIRQRIRNDYPLLSCIDMGIRNIRVPAGDLKDAFQRRRLEVLRDDGVQVNAVWQWSEHAMLSEEFIRYKDLLDGVELQILGTPWPDRKVLEVLCNYKENLNIPITLSTVIPQERIPGKQHSRPRFGYKPYELKKLNSMLSAKGVCIDRVLCRVDPDASPWDMMRQAPEVCPLSRIRAVDWLIELPATNVNLQNNRVAEAVFSSALCRKSRIFLEPLVDLDRTMDVCYGLLDRLCNPRPAFDVVRCINTVIFSSPEEYRPLDISVLGSVRILGLKGNAVTFYLFLPLDAGHTIPLGDWLKLNNKINQNKLSGKCIYLNRGTSLCLDLIKHTLLFNEFCVDGPVLFIFPDS